MKLNPLGPEFYRKLFLLVFLVIIVLIISTPLLIVRGLVFFEEEILESLLLLIEISLAWFVFGLYERVLRKKERAMKKLEDEYQKREKELLETFAYLGKVNVQISYIKDFLKKLKTPQSKKEVKEYLDDILHMALAIGKKDWMILRLINTSSGQTISEHWAGKKEAQEKEMRMGNREIVEMCRVKKFCNERGFCVLSSAGSKPEKEKAFLVFREDNETDRDVLDFMTAAVNQCEIVHNLYTLSNGET